MENIKHMDEQAACSAKGTKSSSYHYTDYVHSLPGGFGRYEATTPKEASRLILFALAAAETMDRLGRRLPIHVIVRTEDAAGTAPQIYLLDWPEAIRHCSTTQALEILKPLCSSTLENPIGEHLLIELDEQSRDAASPAATDGGITVHILCRLGDDHLQVAATENLSESAQPVHAPIAEMFAELLRNLLTMPQLTAAEAQGIGTTSRSAVLGSLAGGKFDDEEFLSIPSMIERSADLHPDAPAVSFNGATLTYRQFDNLANGLASMLSARGIGKGDVIPVILVNGLEMPIAYHALMKIGAAFVPFDPSWPAHRTRVALDALAPKLIVCATLDTVSDAYRHAALPIDIATLTPCTERTRMPLCPDDMIYGIFTSGTTGTPKCAMNKHAGLSNRFSFMTRYFHASGKEVILQNSRHTFDSSVWQLFWPLTIGAHTVIPPQGEFLNLENTIATIAAYGVTMTDFVPSIFNMLVSMVERDANALLKISSLRQLIVGGEEMNLHQVRKLQSILPGIQIINGYGPTEASIGMVFHTVTPFDGNTVPLGRPIDNCYAVILDQNLHLLPPGAVGEIVIGGICLGSGYFGDPEKTAEVFIANPFTEIPGERLYRTGDLGYFGDNGKLYFAGRRDFQVKIGGVRIELGEIEAAAESCPHANQAKVLLAQRESGNSLALFVCGSRELDESGLQVHLRRILPRASLPRYCFVLTEMPLTDNGKVDRRQLRVLLDRKIAEDAAALGSPAAEAMPALDRIWHIFRSVLHKPDFSMDEDFIEAGGDSLQALDVVLQLEAAFQVELSVHDLFTQRTPEAMCRLIEGKRSGLSVECEDDCALMEADVLTSADIPILPTTPNGTLETVLLTGATGFVGSRILYELLTRTTLQPIILCRAKDDHQARARVVETLHEMGLWRPHFAAKLQVFAGDLERPRLGLDTAIWKYLASKCDLILHNGAMVNFLFNYRAHRATNVLGTQELLRLAMTQKSKPLHYISTLGVLDRDARQQTDAVPEYLDPALALMPASGYSRSKWVAERCLLNARAKGARITILRLGEVMPSADNGYPNRHALTHFLLSAFHELQVCPIAPLRSDYTPVNYAATRIVASVSDRETWGRTLHVFHPESVCFTDVLSRICAPIARVSCTEFLERLDRAVSDTGQYDFTVLRALLPRTGTRESALQEAFSELLTDNPRLFRKDECEKLERRWGMSDEWLNSAIGAYRRYLSIQEALNAPRAAPVPNEARMLQ